MAVILNCALLFCVLLYVYPLKFMFTAAMSHSAYAEQEIRMLFTIFSAGFSAVFGVFWLLYRYAWSCRKELELTPLEQLRTRHSMMDESAMVLLGIASILLAQLGSSSAVSMTGLIYFAIPVYHTIAGRIWGDANGACSRSPALKWIRRPSQRRPGHRLAGPARRTPLTACPRALLIQVLTGCAREQLPGD